MILNYKHHINELVTKIRYGDGYHLTYPIQSECNNSIASMCLTNPDVNQ